MEGSMREGTSTSINHNKRIPGSTIIITRTSVTYDNEPKRAVEFQEPTTLVDPTE